MTSKATIGYVGVGLMGLPMAKRLVSLGYKVRALLEQPGRVAAMQANARRLAKPGAAMAIAQLAGA